MARNSTVIVACAVALAFGLVRPSYAQRSGGIRHEVGVVVDQAEAAVAILEKPIRRFSCT